MGSAYKYVERYVEAGSHLSVIRLQRMMELAPYRIATTGCQGVFGPYPSAFLDK